MALSRLQARNGYIIDSMALFLTRNLKVAYDAEVASLAFPTALTISRGKPDDASQSLIVPRIMVDTINGTEADRQFQLGSAICYRHMHFTFYCYPATVNGEPNVVAADLLKSYMMDAFGTTNIQIVDYTVTTSLSSITYCSDVADVVTVLDPIDRKPSSAIAEEKHRFDMHVSIRYPVLESTAT